MDSAIPRQVSLGNVRGSRTRSSKALQSACPLCFLLQVPALSPCPGFPSNHCNLETETNAFLPELVVPMVSMAHVHSDREHARTGVNSAGAGRKLVPEEQRPSGGSVRCRTEKLRNGQGASRCGEERGSRENGIYKACGPWPDCLFL